MAKKAKPQPNAVPILTGRRECPACHKSVYVSPIGRYATHFQVVGLGLCRMAGEPA